MLAILVLALGLIFCWAGVGEAGPMGTAFTYQGRLTDANNNANGMYDFQFKLYDANTGPNQVGSDVNVADVDVMDGYFTLELDFNEPNAFAGDAQWLEIGVRPGYLNDPNVYTLLSPRHEVTPTPYALYAKSAGDDSDWTISDSNMYSAVPGNVGIGTTSPSEKLEVNGNININSVYQIGGETVLSNAGSSNIFVGVGAGGHNTNGTHNSAMGYWALYSNTIGVLNSAVGSLALFHNTMGVCNSAMGFGALQLNSTGNDNSAVGYYALWGNTTGNYNSAVGYQADYYNQEGSRNTIIGYEAGKGTTFHNKSGNVFLGYQAGYNETGSNKLYIANDSADANVLIYGDFSDGNVGIGTTNPSETLDVNGNININSVYKIGGDTVLSVDGISNTLLGVGVGGNMTDAGYNTFVGEDAGQDCNTGIANVAVGYQALYSHTTGYDNSAVGIKALYSNTTGVRNTGIGAYANYHNEEGSRNTIIGFQAGMANANHNKSGNVFLGYFAGRDETGDDKLYIANDRGTPLIYGDFSTSRVGIARVAATNAFEVEGDASKTVAGGWLANSDARIKDDVQTITNALERLDKVRLVSFKYNDDYRSQHSSIEDRRYMNVVAQEFREVFPEYVKSSGEKLANGEDILQVDAYPVTVYSAAAVQELHAIVKDKDAEIAELKERLSKLETMMAEFAREQKGGV
jgi:hypothetical protein